MKKDKNYYLIVDSSEIYKKDIKDDVILTIPGEVSSIFNKYSIPRECRKIVIKVSLSDNTAKELLSNSIYYMDESLVKAILSGKKELRLESVDNIIETNLSMHDIKTIKEFYQTIIDRELSSKYKKAIKEIYTKQYEKKKSNKLRKIKRNEYIH